MILALKFFPKELWSTLDPSLSSTNVAEGASRSKRLLISTTNKPSGLSAFDRELSGEPRETVNKLVNGEEDDETGEQAEEDELPPEEELDDEYASDEDEMAGDYNAEQYFDDGGDDAGEDYDAGEPDAGEY